MDWEIRYTRSVAMVADGHRSLVIRQPTLDAEFAEIHVFNRARGWEWPRGWESSFESAEKYQPLVRTVPAHVAETIHRALRNNAVPLAPEFSPFLVDGWNACIEVIAGAGSLQVKFANRLPPSWEPLQAVVDMLDGLIDDSEPAEHYAASLEP